MTELDGPSEEERMPRLVAHTVDRSVAPARAALGAPVTLGIGAEVSAGRESTVPVGHDPADVGVSRTALVVAPEAEGWRITCRNRNGIAVHPWAQTSFWLPYESSRTLRWPRVGLRIVGNARHLEHWILLEHDGYWSVDPAGSRDGTGDTYVAPRPRRLTPSQLLAVYAVFDDYLAWPPVSRPTARSLEAVAHRLGVTSSAVRERLIPVQERAREIGLHQQFGVTEPEYVFHLAGYGFLADLPPSAAR